MMTTITQFKSEQKLKSKTIVTSSFLGAMVANLAADAIPVFLAAWLISL